MSLLAVVIVVAVAALAVVGFAPDIRRRLRDRPPRRAAAAVYDPGRERRAEARALDLLRSVVSAEEFDMYRALGFISVSGNGEYAYLLYPHRPIVAYDTRSGELLNEYCVKFPDESDPRIGSRLPDADDMLAKWMALHGSERELIEDANMHLPGRHLDPAQVARDLRRLGEWRGRRAPLGDGATA